MDLLDLNEEEIDNFKVRVFILMNPDDDNHKNINIRNLFMIQSPIYLDLMVKEYCSCKQLIHEAVTKFNLYLLQKEAAYSLNV